MRTKDLPLEQQLRRYKMRFRITLSALLIFFTAAGFYIYLNYDYLAFKHFITQFYIYDNTLDDMYKKELKRDVKGKYYSYFDDLVISIVTRSIRQVNNDRYTYLYIPENLQRYFKEEKQEAARSEVKALNNTTVYLKLTNFSEHTDKFMQKNMDILGKYPNLIIDLRDNLGGDIEAMSNISSRFLPKGKVIATDKMRFWNWVYKAKGGKKLKYEKIIILQNSNSASSSENMIAALKDNLDNLTLIGDTTFGKGIGQYTLPLKGGFAVKATILRWYTPKGNNVQGMGIPPDIVYTGSDIVEYALSTMG